MAWNILEGHLLQYGDINTFEKLLNVNELPNIIGVSVLLHDIDNNYLLVARNTAVSVGSGLFACTSSGSLDISDTAYNNPIVACAYREHKEEWNLQVELFMTGLVAPIQKLQPIALFSGMIDGRWSEYIDSCLRAPDFEKENSKILIVPKEDLMPLVSMYTFTDAAAYHIYHECECTPSEWKKAVRYVAGE